MYAPSPDMLVSLPSKKGEALGLSAQWPLGWHESQYGPHMVLDGFHIPVVVRLVPFIPAFIPQHLLESPSVIAVPCQEIGRSVNRERLQDVGNYKIIVSTPCS